MGSFVNTVTSPFHLKLFGGSGYSDNGALDKQQQAVTSGYNNAISGLQGQMSPVFDSNQNLNGVWGQIYNNLSSQIGNQTRQHEGQYQANLSGRGLGGSNLLNASNLYEKMAGQGQMANAYSGLGQAANQQNVDLQRQIAQLYANMGQAQGQNYGQQGQLAQNENAASSSFWQGLAGHLLGGGSIGGWSPFAAKSGAESSGGMNPMSDQFLQNIGQAAYNIPSFSG